MTDGPQNAENAPDTGRQPIFLLPNAVTALAGLLVAIHLARTFVLNEFAVQELFVWGGFVPLRLLEPTAFPGGVWPLLWTPFTHALLHAGWEHILINTAWLAIFATPVVRRYGTMPMLVIFFLGAAVGALAFAATTLPDAAVLIGASGGVAALTGAAVRFIFQPVIVGRHPESGEPVALGRRLASLKDVLRNPRSRWFTLFWVGLNAAVPLLPAFTGGAAVDVAWQAHLGGFFLGLFAVPLFERQPRRRQA